MATILCHSAEGGQAPRSSAPRRQTGARFMPRSAGCPQHLSLSSIAHSSSFLTPLSGVRTCWKAPWKAAEWASSARFRPAGVM